MKKKVGFLKKAVLKLITRMQEITIRDENTSMYLRLTKLHFYLYFGKRLESEALVSSPDFMAAADRHGNMVVSLLHSDSRRKKYLKKLASNSFHKTLILKAIV